MKIKISKKRIHIMVSIILLTLSSTRFAIDYGIASKLEMITFSILISGIIYYYFQLPLSYRKKNINFPAFLVGIFFTIGLVIQKLELSRKLLLLFTMYAILVTSIMAENYICTFQDLRIASYALLWGSFAAIILGIFTDARLFTTTEKTFGIVSAFTGGIVYKNYFGGNLLCIFIGLYLYQKFVKNIFQDKIVLCIVLFLIFISGSRGSWVLLICFLCAMNYKKLQLIQQKQRGIFFVSVGIVAVLVFIYLYRNVAMNSATYMYRFRGVVNYFKYFENDWFHLLFGNGEIAYTDKNTYVMTIRAMVGYDGSMEMAFLNVVVKNGFIGVIGFIIIFGRFISTALKSKNWSYKTACISITITMLVSSLVESYIQSVHAVFGIFGYLALSGLCGMIHKENKQL